VAFCVAPSILASVCVCVFLLGVAHTFVVNSGPEPVLAVNAPPYHQMMPGMMSYQTQQVVGYKQILY